MLILSVFSSCAGCGVISLEGCYVDLFFSLFLLLVSHCFFSFSCRLWSEGAAAGSESVGVGFDIFVDLGTVCSGYLVVSCLY